MRKYVLSIAVVLTILTVNICTAQQQVQVTIENLQPTDGFYFTPVWVGFHNGGFDYFDSGANASNAVELLAEGGVLSDASGGLMEEFTAFGSGQQGVVTGPAGFGSTAGQPPVFDPGEVATSAIFNLSSTERFFSLGSMIIPSNDGFFGNDGGMDIEVLDGSGNFSFAGPIDFTFADLWDAGTELNDAQGAAFSANGGTSTTESNPIAIHGGLGNFDGTDTASGSTINIANATASPVFRVTIRAVPEPSSLAIVGLFGLVGLVRRRQL